MGDEHLRDATEASKAQVAHGLSIAGHAAKAQPRGRKVSKAWNILLAQAWPTPSDSASVATQIDVFPHLEISSLTQDLGVFPLISFLRVVSHVCLTQNSLYRARHPASACLGLMLILNCIPSLAALYKFFLRDYEPLTSETWYVHKR